MHAVKKVYKQVQKTFCEKIGKSIGLEKSMCTEVTKSSKTRLWVGIVLHAPTS